MGQGCAPRKEGEEGLEGLGLCVCVLRGGGEEENVLLGRGRGGDGRRRTYTQTHTGRLTIGGVLIIPWLGAAPDVGFRHGV